MGNDRLRQVCLAIGSGLLAGLALPPLGLPPLLWGALALLWSLAAPGEQGASRQPGRVRQSVAAPRRTADEPLSPAPLPSSLPPLAGGLRSRPLGQVPAAFAAWLPHVVALEGLLWGLAAVLLSHRWLLWLHPLDWIGVPGPLSLPLCLLLWLLIALAGGLLVGLWLALMRRLGPTRLSTALIGSALWGLAEVALARGPLFWIGVGAAALPGDPALAGVAALGGAGLLAALQVLIGWGLWWVFRSGAGRRRRFLLCLGLVLAAHLAGLAALAAVAPEDGPRERVLLLQPAIPTRRKFEAAEQLRLLRQLALAQRAAVGMARTLVLPEGALALGQPLPEPAPVEVLSGGFRLEGLEHRSSLLRFAPGDVVADQWLDKHRLVPLGEWVPASGLLRWSGLSAVGGLQSGPPSRLLRRPEGPVAVAICYELSDGRALASASRDGAQWLLASANLDPYPLLLQQQFTALARLRAIESGRWLVSAANTGPSLAVDPRGVVRSQLPAGRSVRAAVEIHRLQAPTGYLRWGEGPLLVLLVLGVVLRLIAQRGWWGSRPEAP
jgi:apolipoprotein N-acyltransferase